MISLEDYANKLYFTLSLKYQLQALACEADQQANLYPDGCAVIDEMEIEFYHYAEACVQNYRLEVTQSQLASLDNLHKAIRHLAHPANDGWSKSFLYEVSVWGPVRAAAEKALEAFGWEQAVPPPDEGRHRLPESSRYQPGEDMWWRGFDPKDAGVISREDGRFSSLLFDPPRASSARAHRKQNRRRRST